MLSKVSLSEMQAEMESNSDLFDKCDTDHQTFYRFISYLTIIEEELDQSNLLKNVPSIKICLLSIINLKKTENESGLAIKIKTSWFQNLPECLKDLVISEIACPKITAHPCEKKPTETKSPPVNIRTSPKRPLSNEYQVKHASPPEHPRKKKSFFDNKLSLLKNLGRRSLHVEKSTHEPENIENGL